MATTGMIETRMGKQKWNSLLSNVQKEIAFAKRVGWERGRDRAMGSGLL